MVLLAVAVGTALVYAVWVVWVPLLPDNLYVPLLDLGKITGYRWSSAALYLLIVLSLYALYATGYRTPKKTWHVFAAGAVFCGELLWAYPATAVDVFGYIAAGRLLAIQQVNPFIVAPLAFPNDAIVPFLAFPDEPSQYGPGWVLVGGAIAAVSRSNLLAEVLLYKLVGATAHVAGAGIVWLIARRLTDSRERAIASAYLYLWNPMLLWEMVCNAHNDGLMMLFGLLAAWLLISGLDLVVLAAVAAGTLIKLPVALIGPAFFLRILRRNWKKAVEGALLGVALAVAVYRPFWEGPETLTALHRTDLFTASFGEVLRLGLAPTLGVANASIIARTVSLSGFAIVAVLALVFAARAHTTEQVLQPAYFTLLGALLLATTWFQAWYIVWPFALGAALAAPRRHLEVALLSLGGLLQYFVFIYLWVIGVFPPNENLAVQSAAYAAIVGPLAVGTLARTLRLGAPRLAIPKRVPSGEYD